MFITNEKHHKTQFLANMSCDEKSICIPLPNKIYNSAPMQVTVVNAAISCYCSFQCFWLCCSLHRYSWLHMSWLLVHLSPLSTSSAATSFVTNWLCFYKNRPEYRYEHISYSHSVLNWCILWVKNWYLGSEDRLSSRSKSSSASASFKMRQSTT